MNQLDLTSLWHNQLPATLLLVSVRVGAMAAFLPGLSSHWLSLRTRVVFTVLVALLVAPTIAPGAATTGDQATGYRLNSVVDLFPPLCWELLVGATLGLVVRMSLVGMQLAGQWIGQLTGLSLGDTLSPDGDAESSSLSNLFHWLALVMFFATGGHRHSIAALLSSFQQIPLGTPQLPTDLLTLLIDSLTISCQFAIRISLPIVAATMAASLVVGLIARVLPQINTLVLSTTANTLLLFGLLIGGLGGAGWLLEEHLTDSLKLLRVSSSSSSSSGGRSSDRNSSPQLPRP